jgi:DNA-binding GntR family transcriptional regulator
MEPLALIPNLIEQVHLRLVDAIADGTLAPGERLTQEEVAQRLSVSRQPVSHALQLLKRQGLAVEIGKRGLAVAPVEPNRMRDLYQVRGALDGLAARLAAERVLGSRAPTRELDSLKLRLDEGLALGDDAAVREWIEKDVAFHSAIYALSGNPAIAESVEQQWPHFKRSMGASLIDPDTRSPVWIEHVDIAEAIFAGDATRATEASVSHTERAGRALYDRLFAAADAA